jgi:hypothetical protein
MVPAMRIGLPLFAVFTAIATCSVGATAWRKPAAAPAVPVTG